jgi:hypothetical protein
MIAAVTGMNVLDGALLRPLIRNMGIRLEATLIEELLTGFLMGLVICFIYEAFRRQYQRRLKSAVDELNHHVRNSMQVILLQHALNPDCKHENLAEVMERVDWALREVIPKEIQPR